VPQQLSDLRQGRAGSEKLGGETVSEDMGAAVCATFDTGAIESGLDDPSEGLLFSCRTARRSAALRPRIDFSIA